MDMEKFQGLREKFQSGEREVLAFAASQVRSSASDGAASYQLHSVTVVGTVQGMQALPPVPSFAPDGCPLLYGMSRFELVDESGSLPVGTSGSCHPAAMDLPHDGDLVELTAQIQVVESSDGRHRMIRGLAQTRVVLPPSSR